MISRSVSIFIGFLALTSPALAESSLSELMTEQASMFSNKPCLDLIVLQDNFAKSNTTEFEKVMFLHSYAQAVGDVLNAEAPKAADRFLFGMQLLFKECMKNPTSPISEIFVRVSR